MLRKIHPLSRLWAVTLLELMVVVLIIGILATIATGVYSGQTTRARIAAAHALIHSLEVAITRYEIDTGSLPPSGSGQAMPPTAMSSTSTDRADGSGYLHQVLMHSVSGDATHPASTNWRGPYVNLQGDQIGSADYPGQSNILDPWGSPIVYIAWPDYAVSASSFKGGTCVFTSTLPSGGNPSLPAPNSFAATETYYNPKTFQLYSFGPDAETLTSTSPNYRGAGYDDINNFGY